jgi:hypothetical protein
LHASGLDFRQIQNSMEVSMRATAKTRGDVAATMPSLLWVGLFALSLSGCAEGYYVDTYTPDYRYRTYYAPDYYPYYPYYSYYGGAYYYGHEPTY